MFKYLFAMTMLMSHFSLVSSGENFGRSALHQAVIVGDDMELGRLLGSVIDVNVKDNFGCTALHAAAAWHRDQAVALLLQVGADVNAQNKLGETPLYWAVHENDKSLAIIDLLLKAHANVDAADYEAWTPLHEAAILGYEAPAMLLIHAGANINAKNNDGLTPLDIAEQGINDVARQKIATMLRKAGAVSGDDVVLNEVQQSSNN